MDSLVSAINAQKGGAARLELCASLSIGGTTPTVGLLKTVRERVGNIPIFVMIRPRGGDFVYSAEEFEVMKRDLLILKENGADGFVFGMLNPDGSVDKPKCLELITLAKPHPVTFHRAFDMTSNPLEGLETLISLGFQRVLTSGQASTALEGLPLIQKLVTLAQGRVIVMPGAGINKDNIRTIIEQSGACEFHGSASKMCDPGKRYWNQGVSIGTSTSNNDEYSLKETDQWLVDELVKIANDAWRTKK